MAEADFLESICDPISDDTRIRELREDVSRMCRNENVYSFPGKAVFLEVNKHIGSQPVSMDRENVKFISKIEYCVCEKTDGVRYMLLIWQVILWRIVDE